MDGNLSSRIRCKKCGAESYNDGKTQLYCCCCYEELEAEKEKYKTVLEVIANSGSDCKKIAEQALQEKR